MKKALIVIDYQNDFLSNKGKIAKKLGVKFIERGQRISHKIQALINQFHSQNDHVIFLMNNYNTENYKGSFKKHRKKSPYGDTALLGEWGHDLYNLEPGSKDKFIVKKFFDGFYETKLEQFLKKGKITDLYLCGINTDVCVFHTAIGAMIRGYNVTIIKDATATITNHKNIFLNYLSKFVGVKIKNLKNYE